MSPFPRVLEPKVIVRKPPYIALSRPHKKKSHCPWMTSVAVSCTPKLNITFPKSNIHNILLHSPVDAKLNIILGLFAPSLLDATPTQTRAVRTWIKLTWTSGLYSHVVWVPDIVSKAKSVFPGRQNHTRSKSGVNIADYHLV